MQWGPPRGRPRRNSLWGGEQSMLPGSARDGSPTLLAMSMAVLRSHIHFSFSRRVLVGEG